MKRQGIDVSMFQGTVDWHMASQAIAFALCKASQGESWIDPNWKRNAEQCRREKIPYTGYHYFDNNGDSPEKEVKHFIDALQGAGWNATEAGSFWGRFHRRRGYRKLSGGWASVAGKSMPGVFDIESGTGGYPGQRYVRRAVREYVRRTGHHPMIYTGSFWKFVLGNPIIALRCRLWLAAYTPSPRPYIPARWKRATFWQFTDSFHCPGVASPCDGDKFMGHIPRR